ncbi:citryl-CoA lyase [Rugosimonospora acidiphila]|uniref:citrate synthase (unknown stereospecificity) n=1 Tax=Rugosimonospora acidiphila TaxID=556531 RepID=A0ABP9S3V9_9ACTN
MADERLSFPTSIGTSDATTIRLLGQDLAADLMGKVGFGELAYWLVAGRRPTPGEVRVFETVLVALADHGFTPTAIAARLTYLSAPEALQGAFAAGLLGGGSRFLGVTEDCGRFLADALARLSDPAADARLTDPAADGRDPAGAGAGAEPHGMNPHGMNPHGDEPDDGAPDWAGWDDARWDAVALAAVTEARAAGRFIPGLGHPVHKGGDPRTPALIRIADEEGLRGPHLRLFEAIGRVHPRVLGRTLPLNGAGVCGAALADLGLPIDLLRGFALLARAAGLLGHLAEERRNPIGMDIYLAVDRNARYEPPNSPVVPPENASGA